MKRMQRPDNALLASFEREQLARSPRALAVSLDLLDAMVEEARALGTWPVSQGLGDIEHKLRWAKAVDSVGLPSGG